MLNEHGDLHLATGLHIEVARDIGVGDHDGNIAACLFDEAVANLASGEELSFTASQWRIVHANLHGDRRRIDFDKRQGLAVLGVHERFADEDFLEAADAHDIAGRGLLDLNFLQALVRENRCDFRLFLPVATVDANDLLAVCDFAADDASVGDTAEVVAVVEVRHEHAEKVHIGLRWRRDVFHNRLVERLHVVAGIGDFIFGEALLGTGVDVGEIQLLVARAEFHEKLEHHVENLVRTGILAVDLVDDHDRLQSVLHGLAQNEFCLRLRAVVGVHHEQNTIHHFHDALDLSAEVGVAGSIHDIHMVILPAESGVLGADGDAFFPLQIHRVHHALIRFLVGTEGSRLLEKLIHERCLAVIDVGDDGDVANIFHKFKFRPGLDGQGIWVAGRRVSISPLKRGIGGARGGIFQSRCVTPKGDPWETSRRSGSTARASRRQGRRVGGGGRFRDW